MEPMGKPRTLRCPDLDLTGHQISPKTRCRFQPSAYESLDGNMGAEAHVFRLLRVKCVQMTHYADYKGTFLLLVLIDVLNPQPAFFASALCISC